MSQGTGKPTLVSLARELGVSRQTVSNVINSPELVTPKTRARVQAAIEASGYKPSALGRALRTKRSMNLALRVHTSADDINGNVMDRFLHALADSARTAGYRVTIFAARDTADEIAELAALRDVYAIDGCILTDTVAGDPRPAALAEADCPLVAFGRPWGDEAAAHAWVDVDCTTGTREAAEHLRALGHTRVGFLGWGDAPGIGLDRLNGWRDAVADVLDDPDTLAIATEDGIPFGRAGARELLARGATAVVCASDSLALGAFAEFGADANGAVPVTGFDDTPVTRALGIPSVAQPIEDAARYCIETLVTLLKKRDADPSAFQKLLPSRLVLRDPGR